MKKAWGNARKLQEQSDEGVRGEDNAPTSTKLTKLNEDAKG